MDKRKLYKDIARIKKQLFAISVFCGFFLVTVATLLTHGSDFIILFRNAALSVITFGVLGYLWGILYEQITEAPLIESYRMEAVKKAEELKQTGKNRFAMTIDVNELTPGMKCM
ncbi:MAG: hypothetical protein ACP5I1_11340, partial [Candidatus Hinthialibacter sp.]